jgi:23S rRNA (pseudouridine1915-N3)-methyltransferase
MMRYSSCWWNPNNKHIANNLYVVSSWYNVVKLLLGATLALQFGHYHHSCYALSSFYNGFLVGGSRKRSKPSSTSSARLTMICSIKIRIVGRKNSGESWLHDAYTCYETRMRGTIDVETVWHKNDAELVSSVRADRKKYHTVIILDPKGKTYSSEQFSQKFYSWLHDGGSRISFVIGGADGLPPKLLQCIISTKDDEYIPSLSLSTLTMTHQFCRVLLMEQIYRATEIRKGTCVLCVCLCVYKHNRPILEKQTNYF